jgi:hypothetical protein
MVWCLEPSQNHIWFWLRTFFGIHQIMMTLSCLPKMVLGVPEGTLGSVKLSHAPKKTSQRASFYFLLLPLTNLCNSHEVVYLHVVQTNTRIGNKVHQWARHLRTEVCHGLTWWTTGTWREKHEWCRHGRATTCLKACSRIKVLKRGQEFK